MIDVLRCKPTEGELSSGVRRGAGYIGLRSTARGSSGTVEFGTFVPGSLVRWISAEVDGVVDQSCRSCRVRIGNASKWFYFDDNLKIVEVTDADDWDVQSSSPQALSNLDLWTAPELRVIVRLRSEPCNRKPTIVGLTIAMDLMTWEGAIAQASRNIIGMVRNCHPILLHDEIVQEEKSQWKLGEPHSENGHVLSSIVMVSVDGSEKSSTLDNGIVAIKGPPARAGQRVRIAARYGPQTTVRRVPDVRVINKLPCWLVDDLVRGGGMNGTLPIMNVGGVEITRRMVELRMQVRGVAARQADAFAMRAALQNTFSMGRTITLESGRTMGVALMEVVEVTSSGTDSMPIAIGTLHCPLTEYTGYRRATAARRGEPGEFVLATNTMTLSNESSGVEQTVDSSSFSACE